MTLKLKDYFEMIEYNKYQKNYTPSQKKNTEINMDMCKTTGCPCIIPFVDLCNHYQPKLRNSDDRRLITFNNEVGNFFTLLQNDYEIDDEIYYTYTTKPNNFHLFFTYGFNIPNNIFNEQTVGLSFNMIGVSETEFQAFKILDFIPQNANYTEYNETAKLLSFNFTLKYSDFKDNSFYTYNYVKALSKDFTAHEIVSRFYNNKEIPSYLLERFYSYSLSYLKVNYHKIIESYLDSIKHQQLYRKYTKLLEKRWEDTKEYLDKWKDIKMYELVYEYDVSYKRITINHLLEYEGKLITNTHNQILNLRESILHPKPGDSIKLETEYDLDSLNSTFKRNHDDE